jgi:hypothetical protein
MNVNELLAELQQAKSEAVRLEAALSEARADVEAIERLIARAKLKHGVSLGEPDLEKGASLHARRSRETAAAVIRRAVSQIRGREFTLQQVCETARLLHPSVEIKEANVGAQLWDMKSAGILKIVRERSGSSPASYVQTRPFDESSLI